MTDLQREAQAFLDRPVPQQINYVPDSIVERLIRSFALGQHFDDEALELLEICAYELDITAEQFTGDAKVYFTDCANLVRSILVVERGDMAKEDGEK